MPYFQRSVNFEISFLFLQFSQKTKKKNSTLLPWYLKSNCFCLFFGRIEDTRKTIRNQLTFTKRWKKVSTIINWIKTIRFCFLVREYGLHVKIWANSNWLAKETTYMRLFYKCKVINIDCNIHIFFQAELKYFFLSREFCTEVWVWPSTLAQF